MTSPRVIRAEEILTEIRDLLDTAGLDQVHVTINPAEIAKTIPAGVVVLTPPDLTFPTFHITDTSWEIWAITGPAQEILAAWSNLDAIVDTLAAGLEVTGARADSYQPPGGSTPVPAYVLTLTETHTT